jgi:hypothetical protein
MGGCIAVLPDYFFDNPETATAVLTKGEYMRLDKDKYFLIKGIQYSIKTTSVNGSYKIRLKPEFKGE